MECQHACTRWNDRCPQLLAFVAIASYRLQGLFLFMHQSIETPTLPPPGQRGDLTLTAVKSYQMPHPLGPNFLSKWIKMRQTPQGLGTQIKKMENCKDSSKTDTNF